MSIFSNFLELHFSGQKSILYYPEYQNMFLSCFVCSKQTYKKKVEFLQKTMYDPLCKMSVILTLLERNFSGVKRILYFQEYKKLFLSGFFCSKKNMRKRFFFRQKPWTNPFEKCPFFSTLWELHFWGPKKPYILSRALKNASFRIFLLKKTYKKKVDFLTKTMD